MLKDPTSWYTFKPLPWWRRGQIRAHRPHQPSLQTRAHGSSNISVKTKRNCQREKLYLTKMSFSGSETNQTLLSYSADMHLFEKLLWSRVFNATAHVMLCHCCTHTSCWFLSCNEVSPEEQDSLASARRVITPTPMLQQFFSRLHI